ncbi:MAG: ice-binding family protein, partial [Actinomycetota bacterium]|nr:ice-binding family protein [Actinomycetota bacterium]
MNLIRCFVQGAFHEVPHRSRLTPFKGRSIKKTLACLVAGIFLLIGVFETSSVYAAPTPMVNLGAAAPYAVLSGASVGNTVSAPGAPHTTIRGDLGIKADTAPLGFPPGVVTGSIRHGSVVDPAHADVVAAYSEIAARPGGAPLAGALVGTTILPGLHKIDGAASNTGTVTFDGGGDPGSIFVIQVNGALAFAAASKVTLTNGARASRIFWQVAGAGAVGALSEFAGTMIARDAVGMGNGTLVNGRAFARDGALTLDNNQFYGSPPVVSIAGGEAAQTTDTTPT